MALDRNQARLAELTAEKTSLDQLAIRIESEKFDIEESATTHNAETARFNAECLDVQVTDAQQGKRCNDWSRDLNDRNATLTTRREILSQTISDYNARVETYNNNENARACEARELDAQYDEFERNAGLIDSRLASLPETSDIYRRCISYREQETRQRCMQKFWNDEN